MLILFFIITSCFACPLPSATTGDPTALHTAVSLGPTGASLSPTDRALCATFGASRYPHAIPSFACLVGELLADLDALEKCITLSQNDPTTLALAAYRAGEVYRSKTTSKIDAEKMYNLALTNFAAIPDAKKSSHGLGVTHHALGILLASVEHYQRAVKYIPQQYASHANAGTILCN